MILLLQIRRDAMDDRRLSERIPFRNLIKYGSLKPILMGRTVNLSEGGIAIKSDKFLIPESKIVALVYMDDKIVELEGIVAWVSLPETLPIMGLSTIGINFLSSADNIKRIYRQIISEVYQQTCDTASP